MVYIYIKPIDYKTKKPKSKLNPKPKYPALKKYLPSLKL